MYFSKDYNHDVVWFIHVGSDLENGVYKYDGK